MTFVFNIASSFVYSACVEGECSSTKTQHAHAQQKIGPRHVKQFINLTSQTCKVSRRQNFKVQSDHTATFLVYIISKITHSKELLAIRRIFSLVDMITNTKFSNCPNVFKNCVVWQ